MVVVSAAEGARHTRSRLPGPTGSGLAALHGDREHGWAGGAEDQRRFLARELSQLIFELEMERESSVEKAGTRAACAIFLDGIRRCRFDPWVVGQPQVIV